MDNQFPNIPGDSPDNQTQKEDIFKEADAKETPVRNEKADQESIEGERVSLEKKQTYADPNSSGSPNWGAQQNAGGYGNERQNLYQGGAGGTTYGNAQQQPDYHANSGNQGYGPGYGMNSGSGNNGYQPRYNGNPNAGYQSGYIGVPNSGYQQNYANNPNSQYSGMDTSPMSMGDWLLTILACMIPCAGTILSLIWAFGKNGNVNRRNFCRAQLIITAVVIVLYVVIFFIWGVSLAGALSTY